MEISDSNVENAQLNPQPEKYTFTKKVKIVTWQTNKNIQSNFCKTFMGLQSVIKKNK